MTVLPEITEFLAVGNHSSSMPSIEPSPTYQEIGGGGNGETNDRQIEGRAFRMRENVNKALNTNLQTVSCSPSGMLLMAAIFSNMCARKKPKKGNACEG